jgi:serine/threonine-protein kinase
VKGTTALDFRSDLYSLGVVLYHMLCGRPPFTSSSQFEVMLAHVNMAPWSPSSVNPALPRELDSVVLKALAKDPAQRYPNAAQFAAALEATLQAIDQPETAAVRRALPTVNPPHLPMPPVLAPAFLSGQAKPASPVLDWLFYGGLAAGASVLLGAMWLVAK